VTNGANPISPTRRDGAGPHLRRGPPAGRFLDLPRPEGEGLIEGHGVDPDLVVDNLPHATFNGRDAQLDAAVKQLQELIAKDPRPVPPAPKHPDKSWRSK
jgi:hypothetical protein